MAILKKNIFCKKQMTVFGKSDKLLLCSVFQGLVLIEPLYT